MAPEPLTCLRRGVRLKAGEVGGDGLFPGHPWIERTCGGVRDSGFPGACRFLLHSHTPDPGAESTQNPERWGGCLEETSDALRLRGQSRA